MSLYQMQSPLFFPLQFSLNNPHFIIIIDVKKIMSYEIARIKFSGSDYIKVSKSSLCRMRLVHDDGTYLIPDKSVAPLVRPISGELPDGEGDDFCEYVSFDFLKTLKGKLLYVTFVLTEDTISTQIETSTY